MNLFADEPQLAPDSHVGLGRAMVGGAGKSVRRGNDYYPTPDEATHAIIQAEREHMLEHGRVVWEPCGRGGAISSVLKEYGFDVVATDIVADAQNNVEHLNIFNARAELAPIAFTNPPFAIAAEIIEHLLGEVKVDYLALLLKTTYWSAANRSGLLLRFPATYRYELNWRLDFTNGGAPVMDCTWFVWDRKRWGEMRWAVLARPEGENLRLIE